jgi:hypothetical protein
MELALMKKSYGKGPEMVPVHQTPQQQAQTADMSTENAALYERLRRAGAYGKEKTMLTNVSGTSPNSKLFLGATQ